MITNTADPRNEAITITMRTKYAYELQRYHEQTPVGAVFELMDDPNDTDSFVVWRVEHNETMGVRTDIWHKDKVPKTELAVLQELRRGSWFVEPPPEVAPDLERELPPTEPEPEPDADPDAEPEPEPDPKG